MGFINLLKNGYRGKLGETVGQKWKDQLTVRTYQAKNNSKSEAQLEQREFYKKVIAYASELYATSRNLVLPPNTKMNKFNFITSLATKVEDGSFDLLRPGPFMGLRDTRTVYPYGCVYNGVPCIYINDPRGEIKRDLKSISIHILFGTNSRNMAALPFQGYQPESIRDYSLTEVVQGVKMEKGFAVLLTPDNTRGLAVYGYLSIKKGNQRIFTRPMLMTTSIDLTNLNWTKN